MPRFLLSICVNKVQILVWYDSSLVLCFATIHAFDVLCKVIFYFSIKDTKVSLILYHNYCLGLDLTEGDGMA